MRGSALVNTTEISKTYVQSFSCKGQAALDGLSVGEILRLALSVGYSVGEILGLADGPGPVAKLVGGAVGFDVGPGPV